MKKVVVIGEILVEVMADTIGNGFASPQALTGPYPSGAPAIFADQAAKFGQPVAIISAVGNDDFGRLNLARLKQDGVDISGVHVDADYPTGSAFVRYRADRNRDFVFNIKHSACGKLNASPAADSILASADHLHIMGSSLASDEFIALNIKAAKKIRSRGGTVSFDPNVRKEIPSTSHIAEAMHEFIELTDLFLPSGAELTMLTAAQTPPEGAAELIRKGVQAIVHKNGAEGAVFYGPNETHRVHAFPVVEVDPTGAGDCFGGAFTSLWLRGTPAPEALQFAAAAGARAVAARGPMEGSSTFAQIAEFMQLAEKGGLPA